MQAGETSYQYSNEPMRWNSVKETCQWHVFRNSPDRACEGGVIACAAHNRIPSSPPPVFKPVLRTGFFHTKRYDAAREPGGTGSLQSFDAALRPASRSFRLPALTRLPLADLLRQPRTLDSIPPCLSMLGAKRIKCRQGNPLFGPKAS